MKKNDFDCYYRHDINRFLEIKKVKTLQRKTLLNYLEIRGIPSELAALYVKEATWKKLNAHFWEAVNNYGIAVKNDKGGYELSYGGKDWRQTFSKKPHGITTFQGNGSILHIFENIYDFLSFLTYYKMKSISDTVIIYNEGASLKDLLNKAYQYESVNLYLFNDKLGIEISKKIQKKYPIAENRSIQLYPEYKTFNDFLLKIKAIDSG